MIPQQHDTYQTTKIKINTKSNNYVDIKPKICI